MAASSPFMEKVMLRRVLSAGLALSIVAVALLLSGCLPIELEVSPDGKLLIARQEGFFTFDAASGAVKLVYKPTNNQPGFARFVPGGRQIVAITAAKGGGMVGGNFKIEMVDLSTGVATPVAEAGNITYLT